MIYKAFYGRNSGYTYIEVLLYVFMTGVVITILIGMFIQFLEIENRSTSIEEVETQGRNAMLILAQDIRGSKVVNTPTSGQEVNSITLNSYVNTRNPIIYNIASGRLGITESSQPRINITSQKVEVTDLKFTRTASGKAITIFLKLRSVSSGVRGNFVYAKTFETVVYLRN